MKCYISGQITGHEDYMERFAAAEAYIRQEADNGALIYNPARINAEMPKGADYEDYMAVAMAILERCDNIYMLPGWQKSTGANREYGYASASENIRIYELTEENLADGRKFIEWEKKEKEKFPKDVYLVEADFPKYDPFITKVTVNSADGLTRLQNDTNFKNRVFETREEAEQALKELKHE